MRRFLFVMLLCTGCAKTAREVQPPLAAELPHPEPAASALVFDPPLFDPFVSAELARGERIRGAFVGFDELETTFYYLEIDDRQTHDGTGRYERRAIIQRFGTSYR